MHIPDGYLSPATCLVFYATAAPLWFVGARKVESELSAAGVGRLSLASAFVFVIMMFNLPLPGGASGHLVGTAMLALTLGPWAAFISVSMVIFIQALVFGDGGVTAIGANAFNMAFIMSFVSVALYKIIPHGLKGSRRDIIAVFISTYIAVGISALAVSLELGVQPLIAMDAAHRPLYAPYTFAVTIPAVVLPHLLFFAPVEGLATALVLASKRLGVGRRHELGRSSRRTIFGAAAALVFMTPIGLAATGTPWGEWSPQGFMRIFGTIPTGMGRLAELWNGLLPGYGVAGIAGRYGHLGSALVYIFSALLGSSLLVLFIFIWGRLWQRNS